MEICARWFSLAIKEDDQQPTLNYQPQDDVGSSRELVQKDYHGTSRKNTTQVSIILSALGSLLFVDSLESSWESKITKHIGTHPHKHIHSGKNPSKMARFA